MDSKQYQLNKVINFLKSIGIEVIEKELTQTTFLPGLMLGSNAIYIDTQKLLYPGDILHEAGHIAVTPPLQRQLIGSDDMPADWPTMGDEITAILWSFAAVTHLDLPPEFVFHGNGYKDSSDWFIENFTSGNYIGLPLLQYFKMANSPEESLQNPETAFPYMVNWLRPE